MKFKLLIDTIDGLVAEAAQVLATEFDSGFRNVNYPRKRPSGVEIQPFSKFIAGCANLLRMLGDYGSAWQAGLSAVPTSNSPAVVRRILGTLEAIKQAIEAGTLVSVEDLVRADAFNNLLEQAEYLSGEGYFLAAGVLGRAVLEEHLRNWCSLRACIPAKTRPTLNDFKDALYKGKHINAIEVKHVDSMAAVGNACAHNEPMANAEDVTRLLRDVRAFLIRHE